MLHEQKAEFQSLPPGLQRELRLAVAIGWPLSNMSVSLEILQVSEPDVEILPADRDRSIWAGLLEAFEVNIAPGHSQGTESIEGYEVWVGCYWESCLSVIRTPANCDC